MVGFARRGDEVYETQVRPRLTPDDEGRFAAIDIETGEYEIAEDELAACDKLSARSPDAQIWLNALADLPYGWRSTPSGILKVVPARNRPREGGNVGSTHPVSGLMVVCDSAWPAGGVAASRDNCILYFG
jgi:hypothetical protein